MSFDTPTKVKEICKKYNFQPRKSRGQNFLVEKNVVTKIINASNIGASDCILEIGPGLGIMTDELSRQAKKILAVEIDKKIVEILQNEFSWPNVDIVRSDILDIANETIKAKLGCKEYLIVANLPYQITSPIIEKFLIGKDKPERLVVMVQREVGDRMLAKPPHMNLLALMIEFYSSTKKLFRVSKNSFWPKPKVDSVVMEIIPKKNKEIEMIFSNGNINSFWELVRNGYRSKRKYLANNIAPFLKISKDKIMEIFQFLDWDAKIRPENLSLDDWVSLYQQLYPK